MPSFWIENKGSDTILHNKYGIFSKNELELQLKEGHLTINELGEIYDLHDYQMVHIIRLLKINSLNLINTRIINPILSPKAHQVLLGTLLGDASITSKTYRLSHSIKQLDYFYVVAEVLKDFISTIGYKKLNTGDEVMFLWTHRHNLFDNYFNKFYSRGPRKKYFIKDLIYDLDPEGLAYWYMDDGKFQEYGSYLCVGNISNEEGCLLVSLLKDKFGLDSTFQTQDTEKNYHNIYIRAKSRDKFFSLISPFIIPSMNYKLTGGSITSQKYDENLIIQKHMELCKKAEKNISFSGINIKDQIKFDFKRNYMNKIKYNSQNNLQISKNIFRTIPVNEDIIKLLNEGKTDQQIGDIFGYGRNRISILRRSLNIPRKKVREKCL